MVTSNLVRFCTRQLHTVVSREIIKPSSPTPSHLKTHNLTLLDQTAMNTFMPMVTFYAKGSYRSSNDITLDLKNSLSQTLTKYYPFAGRHVKTAPAYVDCIDDGAEFLEAHIDSKLSDFLQNSQHEDLDQFFPNGLVWYNSNYRGRKVESERVAPLAVQVNHFACGGVAVAVSLSHKIADGTSLAHFFYDWATVTRVCSGDKKDELPIHPHFIPFQNLNLNFPGFSLSRDECVTRSFVFPNSKLNELKALVKAETMESGQPIMNPTRVEVLNWLLYKSSVAASAKTNSGSSKLTGVAILINMRDKMAEPLPKSSIGNLYMTMEIPTKNQSEMNAGAFIGQMKKQKMEFRGIRNIRTMYELVSNMTSGNVAEEVQKKIDESYVSSSMCGCPMYGIDFGWGNPVKTTIAGNVRKNEFLLMDVPNGDGIEALVCLEKQDMDIFQRDPELLAFC